MHHLIIMYGLRCVLLWIIVCQFCFASPVTYCSPCICMHPRECRLMPFVLGSAYRASVPVVQLSKPALLHFAPQSPMLFSLSH